MKVLLKINGWSKVLDVATEVHNSGVINISECSIVPLNNSHKIRVFRFLCTGILCAYGPVYEADI